MLRFVMESGAKGCEVIVSGKLRAQRAKSMKFKVGAEFLLGALRGVRGFVMRCCAAWAARQEHVAKFFS